MDPNILFNSLSGVAASAVGILGVVYRRFQKKLDNLEDRTVRNKIQTEKRTTPHDVKEIVGDKIAPIHVILQEIKDDVKEIKDDLKTRVKI